MRLAYNRILKNLPIVERCLFAAALNITLFWVLLSQNLRLLLPLISTDDFRSSTLRGNKNYAYTSICPWTNSRFWTQNKVFEELKQQTLKRRKSNPLWGDISSVNLTFDRFVVGDEKLAHQHALNVAKRRKRCATPLRGWKLSPSTRSSKNHTNSWDIERAVLYKDADAFVDDYKRSS